MLRIQSIRLVACVIAATLIATWTAGAQQLERPRGVPPSAAGSRTPGVTTGNTGAGTSDGPGPGATGNTGSGTSDGARTGGTPGTRTGDGPPRGSSTGTTGGGNRSSDGGGSPPSRHEERNNYVPAIIGGAVAIGVITALMAQERNPAGQPAASTPPPIDQIVERLLSDGPLLATEFNMSAFAVRGFVRGKWPLVIDFQQRSEGRARLHISARDVPEIFDFDLTGACPPPRRCLMRLQLPPEIFGNDLRPAVIAAMATDPSGVETLAEFDVYALGAGPRAVGSVAIDQVSFGPSMIHVAEQQNALYRFYSHSDFSHTSVEFWKMENGNDGTRLFFVDDRLIDGGVRKDQWIGTPERRMWDGMGKGRVSSGRHRVQVRAWDRVGDWVTAWSNDIVTVEQ